MRPDLNEYFARYDVPVEQVEPEYWICKVSYHSNSCIELYIGVFAEWLCFSVSPFISLAAEGIHPRLAVALLRINSGTRLVRLAWDGYDSVDLMADIPIDDLDFELFAIVLDTLISTSEHLAGPLSRMIGDPDYWPEELAQFGR